jgi:hypothetical protein
MKSTIRTEALFAAEISAQGCSARREAQQYVDIASIVFLTSTPRCALR